MARQTCETSNNVKIDVVGDIVSVTRTDEGAKDEASLGLLDDEKEGETVPKITGNCGLRGTVGALNGGKSSREDGDALGTYDCDDVGDTVGANDGA